MRRCWSIYLCNVRIHMILVFTIILLFLFSLFVGWTYENSIYAHIPRTDLEKKCTDIKERIFWAKHNLDREHIAELTRNEELSLDLSGRHR